MLEVEEDKERIRGGDRECWVVWGFVVGWMDFQLLRVPREMTVGDLRSRHCLQRMVNRK